MRSLIAIILLLSVCYIAKGQSILYASFATNNSDQTMSSDRKIFQYIIDGNQAGQVYPPNKYRLDSVGVRLYRTGTVGTLIINIHRGNVSTNLQLGTSDPYFITGGSKSISTITTSTTGQMVYVTMFPTAEIEANTRYTIEVYHSGLSETLHWKLQTPLSPVPDFSWAWIYTGGVWLNTSSYQMNYEVWGHIIGLQFFDTKYNNGNRVRLYGSKYNSKQEQYGYDTKY